MTQQLETFTLVQLLERLCELRPDWCSKVMMAHYRCDFFVRIAGSRSVEPFHDLDKADFGQLDRLRGSIERLIEAEMQKPDNDWFGYDTSYSPIDGHHAAIFVLPANGFWRRNQPDKAVALLGCLVAVLDREADTQCS